MLDTTLHKRKSYVPSAIRTGQYLRTIILTLYGRVQIPSQSMTSHRTILQHISFTHAYVLEQFFSRDM